MCPPATVTVSEEVKPEANMEQDSLEEPTSSVSSSKSADDPVVSVQTEDMQTDAVFEKIQQPSVNTDVVAEEVQVLTNTPFS